VLGALILTIVIGATITTLQASHRAQYPSAVGTPVFVPSPTPTITSPAGVAQPPAPPSPISGKPGTGTPPTLPRDAGIVYTSQNNLYLLTPDLSAPETLNTPGYLPLVPPMLTSDGHLLYAGDGLYLADLMHRQSVAPLQIASIDPATQIIASATINADATQVYWSVEPRSGPGTITLYTAAITGLGASSPQVLYSQADNACPCFMLFGLGASSTSGQPVLLLTDDLGAPAEQGIDLWQFDLGNQEIGAALLNGQGQLPLALSPDHTLVAYAPTSGEVPEPTDHSVPPEVGSQPYGNSLMVAAWNADGLVTAQTLVAPQTNVPTFSAYHWMTTPLFTPDNQSLAYVQFSSDAVGPYDRQNTLYLAPVNGSAAPGIIATFSAHLVELGGWLNSHVLLFYADGGLYALDTHTAAASLLGTVSDYSEIIGVVRGLEPGESQLAQQPHSAQITAPASPDAAAHLPAPALPLLVLLAAFPARANTHGSHRARESAKRSARVDKAAPTARAPRQPTLAAPGGAPLGR
jgi:hypothetical protein